MSNGPKVDLVPLQETSDYYPYDIRELLKCICVALQQQNRILVEISNDFDKLRMSISDASDKLSKDLEKLTDDVSLVSLRLEDITSELGSAQSE